MVSTLSKGCGNTTDQEQHSFFLVTAVSVAAQTNKITLTTQSEMSVGQALPNTMISWGVYNPAGSNATSGTTGKVKRQAASTPTSNDPNAATGTSNVASQPSQSVDCGAPPSSVIDGFFAATCGSTTFDQDIDDKIGYLSFNAANFTNSLEAFVPNLDSDYLPADNNDFAPVGLLNRLRKRQRNNSPTTRRVTTRPRATATRKPAASSQPMKGVAPAVGKVGPLRLHHVFFVTDDFV